MSETIDSQSGIKLSFARSQQLLTVERKSPSFLGELKLSWESGHLSPSVSSILEPREEPVQTESCWTPLWGRSFLGQKAEPGPWVSLALRTAGLLIPVLTDPHRQAPCPVLTGWAQRGDQPGPKSPGCPVVARVTARAQNPLLHVPPTSRQR